MILKRSIKKIVVIVLIAVLFLLGVDRADKYADRLVMKHCNSVTNVLVFNIKAGEDPQIETQINDKDNGDKLKQIINLFKSEDFHFAAKFYDSGQDRIEIEMHTLNATIDISNRDNIIRIREGKKIIYVKVKDKLFFQKLENVLKA